MQMEIKKLEETINRIKINDGEGIFIVGRDKKGMISFESVKMNVLDTTLMLASVEKLLNHIKKQLATKLNEDFKEFKKKR